jgi:hypothetical protein
MSLKERTRKLELPHFVNLSTILKQVDDTTQMLLSVVDDHLVDAKRRGRSCTIRSLRRPASASSSMWTECSGWSRRSSTRRAARRLLSTHKQRATIPARAMCTVALPNP